MGEPARKYQDIEPDIRPNLRAIQGGGETAPGRANLAAVKNLEDNPEQPSTDSIQDQEANGSNIIKGPWENNVSGEKSTPSKIVGRLSGLKKKGPLATIITIVLGGGIGLSTFFSPGLLIVHMKETMVNKFNVQLTSMDVRTTKILKSKTVGGPLCNTFNRCRYSTMSEKQVAKFEKAGIKVTTEDAAFGRKRPISFEFEGRPISSNEFNDLLKKDPKFRSAVRKAYNSKFAGFVDSIWEKITAKFHISKATTEIAGATDEVSLKNIQDATSTGNKAVEPDKVYRHGEDPNTKMGSLNNPKNPDELWDGQAHSSNNVILPANIPAADINDSANEIFDRGTKAGPGAAKIAADLLETGVENIDLSKDIPASSFLNKIPEQFAELGNSIKVSEIFDDACTMYRMVQALGYAAKVVRAVQLARFAMLFLNVADQIKAGNAKPEDVSYLGKILTTEIGGTMALKSATDSFGYKFAAYGERGNMSTTASQFLAGGGLPGKLISLTNTINGVLGGTPRATCKLLGNTFIGLGSAAVGIAMMFIPVVGPAAFGTKAIVFGVAGLAFQVGMIFLPELLKDIVAGVLVDKTTVGEAAGDAYTSGASGIMGSLAQRGGNAPLTPTEAVAYNNLSKDVIAQYAEEDRLAYSPFDITNGNTFMGKIFAQLIPYASKMSSLSGILTSIASIPTRSLAMATSQNAMAAGSIEDYQMCPDMDYNNLTDAPIGTPKVQLATDPYCNVMYGIPVGALDTDPLDVVDALESEGQLNPDGSIMANSDYEKFVTDCIARDRPLGDMGVDFSLSDGHECLFNDDTNKNYYLYYIDQRVLSGMDGETMAIDPGTVPADGSTDPGSTDPGTIAPTEPGTTEPINPATNASNSRLAQVILDSGNVKDNTGQLKQIASGTPLNINSDILQTLAGLSGGNSFTITSLLRPNDSDSRHSKGRAVDVTNINGISPAPGGYNQIIQTFINQASSLLPSGCGLGVPNDDYVYGTIGKCRNVFIDIGSGPHVHLDVGDG